MCSAKNNNSDLSRIHTPETIPHSSKQLLNTEEAKRFRKNLIDWYRQNRRELPWRETSDPYKIWISEIMLQQTRVDQALPYYQRFMSLFPTVYDLAEAGRQKVLKAWEGLGYYSRARNMHQAAQTIVEAYHGKIPDSWENIIRLKGIGPYTAAAILSIAYRKPYAVVDGNVIRVITRFFGIREDVRSTAVRRTIQELADELIDRDHPGEFNQALMETGATVCTPANPGCDKCPLSNDCITVKTAAFDAIPYKSPAKKRPHYHIGVGIIQNDRNEVLIALRPENAMLGGLWEFPGGKQEGDETIPETIRRELREELGVEVEVTRPLMSLKHAYSHFTITLHAWFCRLLSGTPKPAGSQEIRWIPLRSLDDYPFPTANRKLIGRLLAEEDER